MRTRYLRTATILAIAVFGLVACSPRSGTSQPDSTQAGAIPATPTETAQHLCSNPLAPVKLGSAWTYRVSGDAFNAFTFTSTITDVRPDGFTLTSKLDDGTLLKQDWACKAEGLVALSLGDNLGTLGISLDGIKLDLTTSNARGVTLPANLETGTKWTYGLDIAGTLTQSNLSAKANGTIATTLEAVGTESVSVPAGSFQAEKIQGSSDVNLSAVYLGVGIPVKATVDSAFWLAPGVGLVKATVSGNLAGTAFSATTELQSDNVP